MNLCVQDCLLWRDSLDHTFGRACLLERLAGQALDAGYFLPCSCWSPRVCSQRPPSSKQVTHPSAS
ncbi:hypothetical protein ACRRTK_016830 [Alexandromys fortis]